jgi:hypothetical protein
MISTRLEAFLMVALVAPLATGLLAVLIEAIRTSAHQRRHVSSQGRDEER